VLAGVASAVSYYSPAGSLFQAGTIGVAALGIGDGRLTPAAVHDLAINQSFAGAAKRR
jgi:hypothetical protein